MNLFQFALQRLLHTVPVLLGVTLVVHLALYLVPGDVARTLLGFMASDQAIAELRVQLGLDRPILIQYFSWLGRVVQGDLGQSIAQRLPVIEILGPKIVNSLILMLASLTVVVVAGFILSVLAATRFRTLVDRLVLGVTLVLASLPVFWLGIILAYVFGVKLGWFPVAGMFNMSDPGGLGQRLHYLVLPALTTAASSVAIVTRVNRAALVDTLGRPHILAARSRGLPRRRVHYVHGVRNILPTFANITGLQIGYLFGSAIFTEIVFNWPGVGLLLYNAILQRDAPVIQGCTLAVAVVFVLGNFLSDLVVRGLDASRH